MRLIGVDKLLDDYSVFGMENISREDVRDELYDLIDNQPTAYDIDKVVEELELHSFEMGTDTLPAHYVRLNDAIEIVKQGLKEQNK